MANGDNAELWDAINKLRDKTSQEFETVKLSVNTLENDMGHVTQSVDKQAISIDRIEKAQTESNTLIGDLCHKLETMKNERKDEAKAQARRTGWLVSLVVAIITALGAIAQALL